VRRADPAPVPRRGSGYSRRLTPTLLVYICLTVFGLYAAAERIAPYHGLSEAGCRIGFVYDGDTVELLCGTSTQTARLVGFDTPETAPPRCEAERALGLRAKLRLGDLVARAQTRPGALRLDDRGRDRYDRRLVLMLIDGRDVAGIMVAEGLAVPYDGGARVDWCARLGDAPG